MKTQSVIIVCFALLGLSLVSAAPLGTAFTYQGSFTVTGLTNSLPEPPSFDFRFKLFDAPTGGNQIGYDNYRLVYFNSNFELVQRDDLITELDFGPDAFAPGSGSAMSRPYLQIEVRPADTNPAAPYTLLNPRQPVTPTPQAFYAGMAGTVPTGSLTSTQLAPGAVRTLNLEDGAVTSPKIAPGHVLRSLNGLKDDVVLLAGEGLLLTPLGNELRLSTSRSCTDYTNCYWNLLGNGNVTEGVNFLGTTVDVALDLRVNSQRAMRYDFTAAGSAPNIIGGYSGNTVSGTGGTIAGGGEAGAVNVVGASWGAIGGGRTNVVAATGGTIGGGERNAVRDNADHSTIGGGESNVVSASVVGGTIGGGRGNVVQASTAYATIPGGYRAAATNYGQLAYASGMFAAPGDAQMSLYVLRGSFTGSGTNELFLDGVSARMVLPVNGTWAYDVLVVGRNATTYSAAFHLRGVIERNGSATALDGTQLKDVLNNDSTFDVFVEADNMAEALVIKVTNGSGTAVGLMRWVATVRLAEVTFP